MKYLFLLFVFLSSCYVSQNQENQNKLISNQEIAPSPNPTIENKPEEIIPDIAEEFWEKGYFKTINERAGEAGLNSLRKTILANDDLEVRVWMGFGLTELEGFILRRVKNDWSAFHIDGEHVSKKFVVQKLKLNEPNAGWEQSWQNLINNEILTLPNAESVNCNAGANDGFSFVFELKKGKNYRTYIYENPGDKCRESKQVQKILKIIFQDYNFK